MKKIEHHLLTVEPHPKLRVHSYLMCEKKYSRRLFEEVSDKMFKVCEEKLGCKIMLPIVLATLLADDSTDESVVKVREIASAGSEEVRKLLAAATDYHLTIFCLRTDDPRDEYLMDLH